MIPKCRCRYLALTYVPVKRFAEVLTLIQRSNIHLREARSARSTVETDPIVTGDPAFFPLASEEFDRLDKELAEESERLKNDWLAYNGGSLTADNKEYKKPLFFDIALNYVQLDVDRLQERAGKKKPQQSQQPQPAALLAPAPAHAAAAAAAEEFTTAGKRPAAAKAKAEEMERPATPKPSAPAQGGLSTLLGGWWGRR
jgi:signal recognition particle subunit SRP68